MIIKEKRSKRKLYFVMTMTHPMFDEVHQWCHDNLSKHWQAYKKTFSGWFDGYRDDGQCEMKINISDEADQLLFKLRWM